MLDDIPDTSDHYCPSCRRLKPLHQFQVGSQDYTTKCKECRDTIRLKLVVDVYVPPASITCEAHASRSCAKCYPPMHLDLSKPLAGRTYA